MSNTIEYGRLTTDTLDFTVHIYSRKFLVGVIFILVFLFGKTGGEYYGKDNEGNKTEGTETKRPPVAVLNRRGEEDKEDEEGKQKQETVDRN